MDNLPKSVESIKAKLSGVPTDTKAEEFRRMWAFVRAWDPGWVAAQVQRERQATDRTGDAEAA